MSERKAAVTYLVLAFALPMIIAIIFIMSNYFKINQFDAKYIFGVILVWYSYGGMYTGFYLLYKKDMGSVSPIYFWGILVPIFQIIGTFAYIFVVIYNVILIFRSGDNIYFRYK